MSGTLRIKEALEIQVDDFTSLLDLKVISITTVGRIHLVDTDQRIQSILLVTVRNSDPGAERCQLARALRLTVALLVIAT